MSEVLPHKKNKKPVWYTHNAVIFIIFIFICLVWATAWLATRIAVETIPPFTSTGLRFFIACPMLFIFAIVRGKAIWFPKGTLFSFIYITIFYFTIPYWLINFSAQYVSSGLMALLFSTMPVFTLIFSALMLKERVFFSQIIGVVIGFLGLTMIVKLHLSLDYSNLTGIILLLISSMIHAFSYIFIKKECEDISVITLHVLPMGIAGFLLTIIGLIVEQPSFTEFSQNSILALIYLIFISLVASTLYFFLLKQINLVILSFMFIIVPATAVFISVWYEGIPFSNDFLFYMIMLLFGFAITKFPLEQIIQPVLKKYK